MEAWRDPIVEDSTAFFETQFLSGLGPYHTAKPDPEKPDKAVTPYDQRTGTEILDMLLSPQKKPKQQARWCIFSDHCTELGRSAEQQLEHGNYHALWADIDEPGQRTFRDILNTVSDSIDAYLIGYTSKSATEDCQKCRLIIPLSRPACGSYYSKLQIILNNKLAALGIEPDRATERVNQLCYLPNEGAFYEADETENKKYLDPACWTPEIAELDAQIFKSERDRQARQAESKRLATERQATGYQSPIEALKADLSVEQALERYEYQPKGSKWLSPNSGSGTAGVTIKGDRWISCHSSDVDAGIGVISADGQTCSGDVFDLTVHYRYQGDRNEALRQLAKHYGISHQDQRQMQSQSQQEPPPEIPPGPEQQTGQTGVDPVMRAGVITSESAEQTMDQVNYLIADVLEADAIGILGGASQSLKSFLALEVAHCITTGRDFMGYRVMKPGPVLYICGEGSGGLGRRLKGLSITHKQAKNFYLIPHGKPIDQLYIALLKQVAAQLRPALIIYDTFNQLCVGCDNNSSGDVSAYINLIKQVGQAAGAQTSTLIVHHTGKDETRGLEGSHAFVSNIDFEFRIKRTEHTLETVLSCRKQKDGELFNPIFMEAQKVDLGARHSHKDEPITTLVLLGKTKPLYLRAKSDEQPGRTAKDEVLRALRALYFEQCRTLGDNNADPVVSTQDIQNWLGHWSAKKYNRKWLHELLEAGEIRRNGDGYGLV